MAKASKRSLEKKRKSQVWQQKKRSESSCYNVKRLFNLLNTGAIAFAANVKKAA
jgi:hypothetical protein